jgi:hypothetical protein
MRLLVGATLCGRPKTTFGKWQLIIKNSSTQRGEDKGEGEINTLPIADCRLSIEKTKNWIPACAGMTREQKSEIRARARIEQESEK